MAYTFLNVHSVDVVTDRNHIGQSLSFINLSFLDTVWNPLLSTLKSLGILRFLFVRQQTSFSSSVHMSSGPTGTGLRRHTQQKMWEMARGTIPIISYQFGGVSIPLRYDRRIYYRALQGIHYTSQADNSKTNSKQRQSIRSDKRFYAASDKSALRIVEEGQAVPMPSVTS
ncbi:uncharacterized protein BJX67DRAFT_21074 [Aspergillus lucknowensis]|uniref:Uncharacterized protein n=1 Tax=Aspergillus lucknowensis TaxID=176173 RepID=A0ABR4LXB3_9EURO